MKFSRTLSYCLQVGYSNNLERLAHTETFNVIKIDSEQ
jgi:hypothetical protein